MQFMDEEMKEASQGLPPIYRVPTVPEGAQMVVRRLWIVGLVFAIGAAGAFGVSRKFNPSYESKAKIRLKQPTKVSVRAGDEQATDQHIDNLEMAQQLGVRLTSKKVIREMIDALPEQFSAAQKKDRKKTAEAMAKAVALHPAGGHIFELIVRSKDPEQARAVAAYLTDKLMKIHRGGFEMKARRQESFALEQVKDASDNLKKLEQEMVAFLEKNPAMKIRSLQSDEILSLGAGDRLRVRKRPSVFSRSLATLARKNPRLKTLADRKRRLQAELRMLNQRGSSATAALNRSLTAAKTQLTELRNEGKTASHPLVKRAQSRVDKLKKKIAAAQVGAKTASTDYLNRVRSELRQVNLGIRKELRGMSKSIAKPSRQNLAELEATWSRLRRRYTQLSGRLTKLQEVAVNTTLKKNLMVYEAKKTASIMERPLLPDKPVGLTGNVIAAAGGVMSLFGGLVLALGLGIIDIRLRKPEDVSEEGWGLEVLAVLAKHRAGDIRSPAAIKSRDLLLVQDTSRGAPTVDVPPGDPGPPGGLDPESTMHWAPDERTDPQEIMGDTMRDTEPQVPEPPRKASGWIDGEAAATRLYDPGMGIKPGGEPPGLDPMDTDADQPKPAVPGWVDAAATIMDSVRPDLKIGDGDATVMDMKAAPAAPGGLYELRTDDEMLTRVADADDVEQKPDRPEWLEQPTAFHDPNAPRKLGGDAAPAEEPEAYPEEGPQVGLKVFNLPGPAVLGSGVFVSSDRNGEAAEQMRLLAGQLLGRNDAYRRVFAVTSWEPGVGKTTVAANLAMAMAESQRRVLCIDTCPPAATLTRALSLEPDGVGLCRQLQWWLDGSSDPWEVVQVGDSLSVLPAGGVARPVFPLLSSQALERLVYDMLQLFDTIVIDTSALSKVSDAVALQNVVDGYVLVVGRGRSNRRGLNEVCGRIDPRRILGVVFNQKG